MCGLCEERTLEAEEGGLLLAGEVSTVEVVLFHQKVSAVVLE